MIWRTWPRYRVFQDQRNLGGSAATHLYTKILFMDDSAILDSMNLNTIVMKIADPVDSLLFYGFMTLLKSDNWNLIYCSNNISVFTREGSHSTDTNALDKTQIESDIVESLLAMNQDSPEDTHTLLILGQISFWYRDYVKAREYFTAAGRVHPDGEQPRKWLEALQKAESTIKTSNGQNGSL